MATLTFVIPALNEEAYLERCLKSIFKEAGPVADVIVVDNGSTDHTIDIARKFGCTVLLEKRRGLTRARQTGLMHATSDWVAFIDADNELPFGWLGSLPRSMDGAVCASGPIVFRELLVFSRILVTLFYHIGRLSHLFAPMVQGGNFVVDRRKMLEAGGFDQRIDFYGEDTETARRLNKVGKVRFCLDMWCWSSARRVEQEGLFSTGARYIVNYFWVWIFGRPKTLKHEDHR